MSNKKIPNTEITQMAQHPDYAAEVAAIVRSNLAPKLMGEQVLDHHENDIAAALELLNRDERAKLYLPILLPASSNTPKIPTSVSANCGYASGWRFCPGWSLPLPQSICASSPRLTAPPSST